MREEMLGIEKFVLCTGLGAGAGSDDTVAFSDYGVKCRGNIG